MPSPFPGMNPYLEQNDTWEDFHHNFLTRAQEDLSGQVGPKYFVRVAVQFARPTFDIQNHSSIEIRSLRDQRVVTAVELLSPTGKDRDVYLRKRVAVLADRMHLVEIDLRRGGNRPSPPDLPNCDYCVLVSRDSQRPKLCFWPIGLRERLPCIPVPLAPPDADVTLDLKSVLDRAYDAAGYGKYIYAESPDPPLSPADSEWARQFVPGAS